MEMDDNLIFYVNGKEITLRNPDPELNLLSFLRQILNLTGTKLGCGEGGCGACTVLATKFIEGQPRHLSLNACLAPLCSMHGLHITTVEGLGSTKTKLHPVQETLACAHGSQCGFCTPGFVMSMYNLLCNKSCPHLEDVEQAFQGNLCRCTGYRPILQGFSKLAEDIRNESKEVSTLNTNPEMLHDLKSKTESLNSTTLHFKSDRVDWFRPTTLSHLLDLKHVYPHAKIVVGNTELGIEMKLKNLHYPVLISTTQVTELNSLKKFDNGIVAGASVTLSELERCLETQVLTNSAEKTRFFIVMLDMLKWFASNQIRNVAAIGGNIMTASPISDLNPLFLASSCSLTLASKSDGERKVTFGPEFFTGYRRTILKPSEVLLNIELPFSKKNEFYGAYKQSRRREDDISIVNAAMKIIFNEDDWTVGGATFSFGGMAPTTVVAKKASRVVIGRKWNEELLDAVILNLKEELFLDLGIPGGMEAYRSSLVLSLFFKFYVEIRLELEKICPSLYSPLIRSRDESSRHHYQHQSGEPSFVQIYDDGDDDEDVFDGDYGDDNDDDGYISIIEQRSRDKMSNDSINKSSSSGKESNRMDQLDSGSIDEKSITDDGVNEVSSDGSSSNLTSGSYQGSIEEVGMKAELKFKAVGRPMVHMSAFKQTTGEAVYVDDMPCYRDELFISYVLSTKAHAKIKGVDPADALNMKGVLAYLDHTDVQSSNNFGDHFTGPDEEVFAKEIVKCQGQIIGAILSTDRNVSRRAAYAVKVEYEQLKPILTIEECIKNDSFHKSHQHQYVNGDPVGTMVTADHVIEGEVSIGGQEHFYLEPNVCLAIPLEDGGAEVFISSQHPANIQEQGAKVLGVDFNKISIRVLRMGYYK